jgi:hypothetical protein
MNSILDRSLSPISANGFLCEKEAASFQESLIEFSCLFDATQYQGPPQYRSLLGQFRNAARGSVLIAISQQIEDKEIAYYPYSGCVSLLDRPSASLVVIDRHGKALSFPAPNAGSIFKAIRESCPLVSPDLQYHPEGLFLVLRPPSSNSEKP